MVLNKKQGFTLIEVLVSLGIVLVITLLAFPNLKPAEKQLTAEGAVNQLRVDLRDLQNRAQSGQVVSDNLGVKVVPESYQLKISAGSYSLGYNLSGVFTASREVNVSNTTWGKAGCILIFAIYQSLPEPSGNCLLADSKVVIQVISPTGEKDATIDLNSGAVN